MGVSNLISNIHQNSRSNPWRSTKLKGAHMRASKLLTRLTCVLLVGILVCVPSWSQANSSNHLKQIGENLKALGEKMPALQQRALSGAALNAIHVGEAWGRSGPPTRPSGSNLAPSGSKPSLPGALVQVSDPATDFLFSRLTGFTQNETSTAWCGNNVVVGFNDSGSLPESIAASGGGIIGLSFNGLARSADQGRTFQDLGFLNPGSDPSNFLLGDPVLACTDASTFYYASILQNGFFPVIN